MTIKTIIIEDEEKSLYVLQEFIRQAAPDLKVCATAGHVDTAIELISSLSPQLVLLDIRIGGGLGFDVLKRSQPANFELICITAYDGYALEAFRYAAIDYLLKPLGMEEFGAALGRARQRLLEKSQYNTIDTLLFNLSRQQELDKQIAIPTSAGYDFVCLRDVLWCQSEGAYTIFHLINRTTLTSTRNLGAYEDLFGNGQFFRIHHNAIVNMRWIAHYKRGKGGVVVLADGTELEVSQRRRSEFLGKFTM